jgi:mono/diheme cytochrome c family protein
MEKQIRTMRLRGTLAAALLVALGLAVLAPRGGAQTTAAGETAESTFKAKCVTCHGEDGAGTVLGNRMHVKDLRSKEVLDKTNADLTQAITAGKNFMPAFGGKLDADQIQKLIEYIRSKAPKSN